MNKVADKIMPKEIAKVMPYIAMAAPFLGPVGMLATLPAQALADAKNYGKLNYKKLALQAAMTGIAKGAQAGKATAAEKGFMGEMGGDPLLNPDSFRAPTDAMKFAADNPDAFKTFAEGFKYEPGIAGIGQRFTDAITKSGRAMYNPIDFSEPITPQLLNKGRFNQAMALSAPMGIMAGMDAMDAFKMQQRGGAGTDGAPSQDALAQANYDLMNLYGRNAGYTQDDINTIYGPIGAMYGGKYNEITGPLQFTRRQFPGTNYPIFSTFMADGGRVGMNTGGSLLTDLEKGGPHKEEDIGIGYELMETYNIRNKAIMEAKRRAEREAERMRKELYQEYMDRHEQMLEGPLGDQVPPAYTFEEMFPFAGARKSPGANEDAIADQMYNIQMQEMMNPRAPRAGGGIMQAPGVPAGMELDYRNSGGFIPMGGPERADDVPAMLSKNEFVMTADAVRGMGDGDVNRGAQRMYDLMNNMEAKV